VENIYKNCKIVVEKNNRFKKAYRILKVPKLDRDTYIKFAKWLYDTYDINKFMYIPNGANSVKGWLGTNNQDKRILDNRYGVYYTCPLCTNKPITTLSKKKIKKWVKNA